MDLALNLNTETIELAHPDAPLVVTPETTIREVFKRLKAANVGSLLVCDDRKLVGIFTERDALGLMAQKADLGQPIESVMIRTPSTLKAGDTVAAAIRKMSFGGYRRMPIVDGAGRPVGVLRVRRIVHYLVEHFPKTVYNLPPKPHAAPNQREGA